MKLEFRHLSPYFPYGLNLQFIIRGVAERTGKMTNVTHDLELTYPTKIGLDYYDVEHIWMYKPILRPLSEADVLIYNEFVKYNNNDPFDLEIINIFCFERIEIESVSDIDLNNLQYEAFEWLVKNHFDVFGLIPAGLAISYKEAGL